MIPRGYDLLPHPRPVQRKTSDLDGYYRNGIPVTTAYIGDTITYDVPGHSPGTVYLVQNVNGSPGYKGPFSVPMAPMMLTPAQQTGLWSNTVYDKEGGQMIEQDSITILQPSQTTKPPTAITCPDGYTYYPPYTDPNGNPMPGGCMVTPQKTGTTTTPTKTTTPGTTGTTTTTTTTSTTASSGGGPTGGGPSDTAVVPAPDNSTLILLALAALAITILK